MTSRYEQNCLRDPGFSLRSSSEAANGDDCSSGKMRLLTCLLKVLLHMRENRHSSSDINIVCVSHQFENCTEFDDPFGIFWIDEFGFNPQFSLLFLFDDVA